MKKHLLLFLLLALFLNFTIVHAQDDVSGMAAYFPYDTMLFAATRTDEGFLDLLNNLSNVTELSGVPFPTLRTQIDDLLREVDAKTDLDTIMSWLGDYAAFGILPGADAVDDFYFVLEIEDRAVAESYFESVLPSDYTKETDATYTTFSSGSGDGNIAIDDTLALIYPDTVGLPLRTREARLNSNATFQQIIAELPADLYNVLLYADPSIITEGAEIPPGILPDGALAAGLTILDDSTYVIDLAQLGDDSQSAPTVDRDFARFIPRNASMIVHATDLTALYDNLINVARNVVRQDSGNTAADPADQIEQTLAAIGINLREDFLSWTTGDYALFTRFDILDLLPDFAANPNVAPDLNGRLDFGLVIEATDPDKAEKIARQLGLLARQFGTSAEGLTVSSDKINGVDVTVLGITTPISPTNIFNLEIAIGASDDVLFIATRPAVTSIITGDGTLATSPGYLDAQPYMLQNPTSIWYADSEGLLIGVGGVGITTFGVMGASVSGVFDEISDSMSTNAEDWPTPTPQPTPTPTPLEGLTPEQIVQLVQSFADAITSSSISSTITANGTTLVRFAISLDTP